MQADNEPEPGTEIGPYIVRGQLGRGGMATVYEVEPKDGGPRRALKLLLGQLENPETAQRFHSEFRVLSQLDHPNITRVYDSGEHHGRAWFAMELLEGADLRQAIESWRSIPPSERFRRAEQVLVQVAEALVYIHDRGLVHRDVTPGNIMISPEGRVRLMDFGVVHAPGADLTTAGEMVGTVAYIAPEQISREVNGGRVDARTDLYALGAVLYHMIVGRRPFSATTIPGLLEKHLAGRPKPPRDLLPTVPRHLNDICLRLLEKDPADRYGSAQHLLAVLQAHVRERFDVRRWSPRMVGRTAEASLLREAVEQLAASGRGAAVVLEGPSGYGKTRLLNDLHSQALGLGLRLLAGQCPSDQAAYGGFRAVLEALGQAGVALPKALEQALLQGIGDPEPYNIMSAFRDLLRANAPLVLTLDRLERADRGTITLLEFLVRNLLHLAKEPILIVVARDQPVGLDPLEGWLTGDAVGVHPLYLPLRPLGPTAVEELLLQLVQDDERMRVLAQRLHREGEGNPLFIVEMIRGLVDQGVICEAEVGYRLDIDATDVGRATLPIPSSIREALRERMSRLSASSVQVAAVVALCQQEVTFDVLLEALGVSEDELLTDIDELVECGVLVDRQVGVEELYDLAQPRLRDILVEEIGAAEAIRVHRRLGVALERLYRQRVGSIVETVAYHFEAGEMPGKAFPYLLRAGIRLRERGFVQEALDFFNRALAIEPDARELFVLEEADRQLAELRIQRGLTLHHLGSWTEAEEEFSRAEMLAMELGDDRLRARALTELGNFARRQHRIEEAESSLTEALTIANRLGDSGLRVNPLNELGALRWTRGDLDGARQFWLEALGVAGTTGNDQALGQGYNGLGLTAFCRGQAAEARKQLEQSCQIYERLGKFSQLAISRTNLVELYHCTGNLRKGLQLAERTVAQSREIHHAWGIGVGLRYRSMLLVDLGRLTEAAENGAEAMAHAVRIHDGEEELAAAVCLVRVAFASKDTARAAEMLTLAEAKLGFDSEGYTPLIWAWRARVHALNGEVDEAKALLAKSNASTDRNWPHQRCRLDLIGARVWGQLGDRAAASASAEEALRRADTCGFRFYSMKAHLLLARYSTDPDTAAHHDRVGRDLARSLAASLTRDDVDSFMAMHNVAPGPSRA